MVLIFAVYSNLVAAYVARREELVLKRLRTGELRGPEILAGTALPRSCSALAQCVLLRRRRRSRCWTSARRDGAASRWSPGLLLGIVLLAALAAVTSAFTRTVESAQLTAHAAVMLVSLVGLRACSSRWTSCRTALAVGAANCCPLSPVIDAGTGRLARRLSGVRRRWGTLSPAWPGRARGVCCAAVVPLGAAALAAQGSDDGGVSA